MNAERENERGREGKRERGNKKISGVFFYM
jgi:hypothetical protein